MKNRLCWFGKLNRTLKKQKGPHALGSCFTVGLRGCDSGELEDPRKDSMLESVNRQRIRITDTLRTEWLS